MDNLLLSPLGNCGKSHRLSGNRDVRSLQTLRFAGQDRRQMDLFVGPTQEFSSDPTLHALSGAQPEILGAQKLGPDSLVFTLAEYLEISEASDLAFFRMAVHQTLAETDVLQIRFIASDAGTRQYIESG